MHVAGTHASVVGQDAHEAGGEVAGLVVGVQELDMPLNRCGGGEGGSVRTGKERARVSAEWCGAAEGSIDCVGGGGKNDPIR